MRKIILYSAASLDQFIARKDGAIDWLFTDQDYGFHQFFDSVDTTLMGNKTYQQVLTFGGEFPYKGKENYVFSRNNDLKDNENVHFISENINELITDLKSQSGKDIWLIGGGEINSLFFKNGWIDNIILSIHPIWLGEGLPLFPNFIKQQNLLLKSSKAFDSGLLQLEYAVKKTA